MNGSPPKHLYKFCKTSRFCLESMILEKSWYSAPEKLNDPYDGQLPIDTTVNDDFEAFDIIVQMHEQLSGVRGGQLGMRPNADNYQNVLDDYCEEFLAQVRQPGICSLTGDANHLLLWSHYADSHRGIALRFDMTKGGGGEVTEKVQYVDKIPTLHIRDYLKQDGSVLIDRYTIKGSAWKYEKEWRAISFYADDYFSQPGKLDGIIFGHRTPACTREAISKIVSEDVELLEAIPHTSSFEVSLNPCEIIPLDKL